MLLDEIKEEAIVALLDLVDQCRSVLQHGANSNRES
jgi:hypothetical protein